MAENKKIYDVTFKRMFRLSGKMLIRFVNKIFVKEYPFDAKVRFLDTHTEGEDNDVLEKDIYFEICGERYQVEAQTYYDDMMIRLFQYATNSTNDGYEKVDATHAVFKMPKQAVVFLKGTDKNNDKLYVKLILPDEQEVEYCVHAIRALGYSAEELVENDLEILLPFQIMRMWNKVAGYNDYSQEKKDQFIDDFKNMCESIIDTMNRLLENGKVTGDECRTMFGIIQDLKAHIYSSIEDIQKKGADIMVKERFVLSMDRIEAEAIEKTTREIAERMIRKNKPVDEIEEFTDLNVKTLKEIATAIGCTLVL